MECLVELFDNDQINNLVVIMAFKPKKAIFLYDPRYTEKKHLEHLKIACKSKLPKIIIDFIKINSSSIDEILDTCVAVIHKNPKCFFDITGGGELGVIGTYLACRKTFTPIFKIDIHQNQLINIYGCKSLEKEFSLPNLTIDTIFLAHGAKICGYNHPQPPPDLFDNILEFCKAVFADINTWKDLCYYLQTGLSCFSPDPKSISFFASKTIQTPRNRVIFNGEKLLLLARELNFIYNLKLEGNTISFFFKNQKIKKYMTDFGSWLELYSYITLKKCNLFHDRRMSVKIDWNINSNKMMEITNEIDATFFYGIHPYFVSCKLTEPSSEALHELSMYPSYFGGPNSRCILVVLEKVNKERSYIYKRAKEMNITIIDGSIIRKGKFIETIQNSLKKK